MSKKKSIEELEAAAKAAEERAKKLRAQAKRQTQAERARVNHAIILEIEAWYDKLPTDARVEWEQMPHVIEAMIGTMTPDMMKNYKAGLTTSKNTHQE